MPQAEFCIVSYSFSLSQSLFLRPFSLRFAVIMVTSADARRVFGERSVASGTIRSLAWSTFFVSGHDNTIFYKIITVTALSFLN